MEFDFLTTDDPVTRDREADILIAEDVASRETTRVARHHDIAEARLEAGDRFRRVRGMGEHGVEPARARTTEDDRESAIEGFLHLVDLPTDDSRVGAVRQLEEDKAEGTPVTDLEVDHC